MSAIDTSGSVAPRIDSITDLAEAKALAQSMWDALCASREMTQHMHRFFGGWAECKPCEKANDECDGSYACDEYKAWQQTVNAAWGKS
jgi:hypothetical protein